MNRRDILQALSSAPAIFAVSQANVDDDGSSGAKVRLPVKFSGIPDTYEERARMGIAEVIAALADTAYVEVDAIAVPKGCGDEQA